MWRLDGSGDWVEHPATSQYRGPMRLTTLPQGVSFSLLSLTIAAGATQVASPSLAQTYVVPQGTILRVTLSAPWKPSHLKAGSEIEGTLTRPLFVYDREVLPAGTHVHAIVADVEHHKAAQKKGMMERLQSISSLGLNRKLEYDVHFQAADLQPPSGSAVPIDVRFVDGGEVVSLHTKGEQVEVGGTSAGDYAKMAPGVGKIKSIKNAKKRANQYRHPEMSLETEQPISLLLPGAATATANDGLSAIPAGTHARLLLLEPLSASDNKQGDVFHARVLEPIFTDGKLLVPEGSTLVGHIGKVVPPRRLNRAASLYLAFDKLVAPNGESQKVAASVVRTDLNEKDAGKMDEEGGLHGNGRGVKKTLESFGVGLASQQIADEVVEIGAHAAGPYVSIPMGLFMFLGGHGHDVELPRYSELEISFGRSMPIGSAANPAAPAQSGSEQKAPN